MGRTRKRGMEGTSRIINFLPSCNATIFNPFMDFAGGAIGILIPILLKFQILDAHTRPSTMIRLDLIKMCLQFQLLGDFAMSLN